MIYRRLGRTGLKVSLLRESVAIERMEGGREWREKERERSIGGGGDGR